MMGDKNVEGVWHAQVTKFKTRLGTTQTPIQMCLPNWATIEALHPHEVHAASTCTMALKGSGPKGGILS